MVKHADWGDPTAARIAREAEVLSHASHPSLVRVEAVLEDEVGCALVVAHCPGGSLADEVAAGRTWPAHDVADAGARLCGALAAVHATGFVHGDVHPGNVVLDAELQPVLIDLDRAQPIGTIPASVAGDPDHVDHRLLSGTSVLTPATDLHGLATTLWTLATGTPPERDSPETPVALPSHADVPEPLRATLERCVEHDVEDAAALAVELQSLARSLATDRVPATVPSPPAARPARQPPTTRHWGPPTPPRRGTTGSTARPRRKAAVIAAVVATIGVAVGVGTTVRSTGVPRTASPTAHADPATCAATPGVGDGLRVDIDRDGCAEPVTLAGGVLRTPTAAFSFGDPGDVLLAGDWNGDGHEGVGLYRPSTGAVLLVDDPGPWARSHPPRHLAVGATPQVITDAHGARVEVRTEPSG